MNWLAPALLAALLGAGAPPRGSPPGERPDGGPPPRDPDAEVIENLELLERMELLDNLDLLEAKPGDGKDPQPPDLPPPPGK